MKLPTSAFTPGLSTSALQLIDRPFDHWPVRKKGFDEPLDLVGQTKKGLSKSTELLSVCFILYAHI
jgi:hypothetical protein